MLSQPARIWGGFLKYAEPWRGQREWDYREISLIHRWSKYLVKLTWIACFRPTSKLRREGKCELRGNMVYKWKICVLEGLERFKSEKGSTESLSSVLFGCLTEFSYVDGQCHIFWKLSTSALFHQRCTLTWSPDKPVDFSQVANVTWLSRIQYTTSRLYWCGDLVAR